MNLLLSNDDGVRASGLNFLYQELKSFYNTKVVAPHDERSSCGHAITLGAPVRLKKVEENIYSCTGFPADCVLVGMSKLFDKKPDLVVSGINHGANLGQDRYYSGTMAAAREAAFRHIPAIAVSLVTKNPKDLEHFETAAIATRKLIDLGVASYIPKDHLLNINVPNKSFEDIAGLKLTTVGFQRYTEEVIERVDGRGQNYYWVGGIHDGFDPIEGSDCVAVDEGYISINLQNLKAQKVEDSAIESLKGLIEKF
jgi:5'-nucleotidase